jgi:aspartyl/asparaginyl-tRNA synthetase
LFERVYVEEAKGMVGETVTLAGWVTRARDLRKIMFIVLRDKSGDIQVTVKKDGSNDFADLDLGREDVLKVTGKVVETQVAQAGVEFIPTSSAR